MAVLVGVILKCFQKSFCTSYVFCAINMKPTSAFSTENSTFFLFFFNKYYRWIFSKQSPLCGSCNLLLNRLESELWVSKAETLCLLHKRMVGPFENKTFSLFWHFLGTKSLILFHFSHLVLSTGQWQILPGCSDSKTVRYQPQSHLQNFSLALWMCGLLQWKCGCLCIQNQKNLFQSLFYMRMLLLVRNLNAKEEKSY